MDFNVIRSRRKTIAVEITKEGGVLVRAPLKLARREVLAFVHQNRGWIARKLAQARVLQEERTPRRFREGETFPFLGEQHRLRYVAGGEYLRKENGEFLLGADLSSRAGDLFRTWYRARAREILEDRVAQFRPADGADLPVRADHRCERAMGLLQRRGEPEFRLAPRYGAPARHRLRHRP